MPRDLSVLTQPDMPSTFGGLALTSVAESEPWLNILLYGDPGVGKTVLAGSAEDVPSMYPVIVGDVEGGGFSLRAFHPGVHLVRIKSLEDLVNFYQELAKGEHPYKTVVLDSLSEITKMIMSDIMKAVVAEDPERDPDIPSLREWGKLGEQMRRMTRRFRDLPMNTIFTALLDEVQDKKGRTKYYPMLGGKLKREISGFMDIVLYVYTKQMKLDENGEESADAELSTHRFVLSSSTDDYVCKDRSNRLPTYMLDPTMTKIHNLIQGGQ